MRRNSSQVEEGSNLELRFKVSLNPVEFLSFQVGFLSFTVGFLSMSKVLHSGTQPEMLDIRLNGESLCSTVGDCGAARRI